MNKKEIIQALKTNHHNFFIMIGKFSEEDFRKHIEDKWSPQQNLVHIVRSIQPLAYAYNLPKWLIKLIAGRSNRPSKSYEELVAKYKNKLSSGYKAMGRFIPPKKLDTSRKKLIKGCKKHLASINNAVENKWSEEQLDTYIFPHPLLGKITAREMLYFTAYHAQHHQEIVEKYYLRN
ncbi:MAG: DinB family protein [Fimbriimonadaceae bacterium]|nr:DinB family protein [Chitinophagales bacterium]